jgi:hypothetical protein
VKRKWLTAALAAIFIVAFTGIACAWTSEIEDRPFRFANGGGQPGYYAWHDEYGFHLWMLPGSGSHTFTGTIRTDGRFFAVRGHHLRGGESFAAYPEIRHKTWFEVGNPSSDGDRFVFPGLEAEVTPTKIFFKFNSADASDGIYFQVANASYIGFDLQMDGRGINRKQIWYGGSSWHPETYKFKFENK